MTVIQSIQNRIYEIRGERVMLDKDLASLYEIETKFLNLAVKRNLKRFPDDFTFQLAQAEFDQIKNQIMLQETSDQSLRLQNVTLKTGRGQHRKYLPYAFTEQGVAMLSGIRNSDKAINMNIAIMRAFVEIRRIILHQPNVKEQLSEIKQRMSEHDVQLSAIYDAIETCWMKMLRNANGMEEHALVLKNNLPYYFCCFLI